VGTGAGRKKEVIRSRKARAEKQGLIKDKYNSDRDNDTAYPFAPRSLSKSKPWLREKRLHAMPGSGLEVETPLVHDFCLIFHISSGYTSDPRGDLLRTKKPCNELYRAPAPTSHISVEKMK
jgi:hypothetical protein